MLNILIGFVAVISGCFRYAGEAISADTIAVIEARIQQHVEAISKIGNLGPPIEGGYTRAAWSDEESKAMEYIRQQGLKAGLESKYDTVGNLFLRTRNNSNLIIQVGSHLDTVPIGGTFDGAAGIIAGLESIRSIIDKGLPKDKTWN